MLRKPLLVLALLIVFTCGALLHFKPATPVTQAQSQSNNSDNRILISGNGDAKSSRRPPIPWERFTMYPANAQRSSFKVVPPGKTFVLTDIMYNTRLARQELTVNFAKVNPDDKTWTLFQIYLKPGGQEETHLCTGYSIPSGYGLGAWTNAGLEPDQVIQIAVTGYLIDQ